MPMKKHVALLLLLVPTSAFAQSAENGQKLFMAYACYSCHGTLGQGSGDVGAKLAPDGPDLAAIKQELRHPAARMPAYSESVLPDEQVADIAEIGRAHV